MIILLHRNTFLRMKNQFLNWKKFEKRHQSGNLYENGLFTSKFRFIAAFNVEPIPEPILETDSRATVRNQFQKTKKLAGIDSDENFIYPIT